MEGKDQGRLGVLLVTTAAIVFSTAGIFTRVAALDAWTILFWRGLFGGLFVAGAIVALHRGEVLALIRATGTAGLAAALCSTLATICFINALRRTTVADVAIIYATAPVVTAGLVWLWSAERMGWPTLAASIVALAGVVLMFGGALSAGHVVGDMLAFAMTLLLSAMMVIIRNSPATPVAPAACLSAFLCAVFAVPLADIGQPARADLCFLFLFGMQFGLGLLLLTLGSRLIAPTRAAVIVNLELPLAPLWVWLVFGEIPPLMTCIGGGVVTIAVVGHMLKEEI